MKTELLALIDDLVKSELYVTEGKFSAAKDAKRIRADIVFLLDKAEQAPAAKCETCNDNGLIGGPSFYDPGEGGVPCPDCSAPTAVEPVMKESKTELLTAVRTAPERIWLDLGDREAMDENFRNLDEVTWSAENATGHGVPYIRADLVEAAPADALDAAFEAVRKKLCKLPKFSFVIDREYGHVTRKQDDCGRWIEFDEVHELFDPVAVDAAIAAQAQMNGGA